MSKKDRVSYSLLDNHVKSLAKKQFTDTSANSDDTLVQISDVLNRLVRQREKLISFHGPDGIELASSATLLQIATKPRRASELAQITYCDPSTITRRVQRLIDKKLVEKHSDPDDGRATILIATKLGKQRAADFRKTRYDYYTLVFQEWLSQDRELFVDFLLRFVNDSEKLTKKFEAEIINTQSV